MSFCPKWLFEAACGAAAADFLGHNVDLNTVASSYAKVLAEFYNPISPNEFAEFIVRHYSFSMNSMPVKRQRPC